VRVNLGVTGRSGFAAYLNSRKLGGRFATVGDKSPTYQPSPGTKRVVWAGCARFECDPVF